MRVWWALLLPSLAVAAPGRRLVEDFEHGVAGWWTNPWGGGAITVTASPEARFGTGCLRADYALKDGKLQGNLVGPFLPAGAPWRQEDWGALSLWYRTAGEAGRFNLSLNVESAPNQPEEGYSRELPATPTWQRLVLEPRQLWNRQGRTLDLRRLGRLIVFGDQPGTLYLDQIKLLPPGRRVSFLPYRPDVDLFELGPGQYQVDVPPTATQVRLAVPGAEAVAPVPGPEDEASVSLTATPTREGEGVLILEPGGRMAFPVLLPAPEPEVAPLGIFPTPKRLTRGTGAWTVGGAGRAAGPGAERCAERLRERLAADHGCAVQLTVEPTVGRGAWLRFGDVEPLALPADLKPEGYTLRVTPAGAALAARDERGLFYAALSLLQLIDTASTPGKPVTAPAVEVVDWPDLPVRAVSLPVPTSRWGYPNNAPVPPAMAIDFLERAVVRHKLNTVVLLGLNGVQFSRLPNVSSPSAWTPDELRGVLAYLRRDFVEPIPLIDSLGHADWLLVWRPDLADHKAVRDAQTGAPKLVPDTQSFDTTKPETWTALTTAYEEVLGWFAPRRLHIGLDEVRWQVDRIPPALRTPADDPAPRADRLAGWVNKIHDWLAARGVGMAMWTDMLTTGHNGAGVYATARALPKIPRDTWMFNWSSDLSPRHDDELRTLGFAHVFEANSEGVNRERALRVEGNVVGLWTKLPWLTETVGGANEYSYLNLLHGAEYGWRTSPRLDEPKPRMRREFFAQPGVAEAEATAAWQTEPAGAAEVTPLEPGPAATQSLDGWFREAPGALAARDVRVPLWTRALAPGGELPVARRVAALYLAEAADGTPEALGELRDEFKHPAWYAGRPLGTLTVRYADGTSESAPIRFGWDVRARRAEALPATWGALTCRVEPAAAGETAVYLRQWVNPKPTVAVTSVKLESAGTPVTPLLLGAAARAAR